MSRDLDYIKIDNEIDGWKDNNEINEKSSSSLDANELKTNNQATKESKFDVKEEKKPLFRKLMFKRPTSASSYHSNKLIKKVYKVN